MVLERFASLMENITHINIYSNKGTKKTNTLIAPRRRKSVFEEKEGFFYFGDQKKQGWDSPPFNELVLGL